MLDSAGKRVAEQGQLQIALVVSRWYSLLFNRLGDLITRQVSVGFGVRFAEKQFERFAQRFRS